MPHTINNYSGRPVHWVLAHKCRKLGIYVAIIQDSTGELYWSETEQAPWRRPYPGLPPRRKWRGPFQTKEEAEEHQQAAINRMERRAQATKEKSS
jgi:hypothetical protein